MIKQIPTFHWWRKSGLQVEDPNKDKKNDRSIIDQIFQKAREQMQQPDDRPSARHENDDEQSGLKFSGKGFKLGDGNEPSQIVEDPNDNAQRFRPSKVNREITFGSKASLLRWSIAQI